MAGIADDAIWKVVDAWFHGNGLAALQINSYDNFIEHTLGAIMSSFPPLEIMRTDNTGCYRHRFRFASPTVVRNTVMKPNDCRIQSSSYLTQMKVYLHYELDRIDLEKGEKQQTIYYEPKLIDFCLMPVMVQSSLCYLRQNIAGNMGQGIAQRRHRIMMDECPYDEGGYFIIRGSEKAVIAQEANHSNRVMVLPGDKGKSDHDPFDGCTATIDSVNPVTDAHSKLTLTWRTTGDLVQKAGAPQLMARCGSDRSREEIPFFLLLMALWPHSKCSAKDLISLVCLDETDTELNELIYPSFDLLEKANKTTQDACLDFLKTRLLSATENVDEDKRRLDLTNYIATRILPHVGTSPSVDDKLSKAFFLGYMAHRLLLVVAGRRTYDDRDHWGGKRLKLTGTLLADKFRYEYNTFLQMLGKHLGSTGLLDLSTRRTEFSMDDGFEPREDYVGGYGDSLFLSNPYKLLSKIRDLANSHITKNLISGLSTGTWKTNNSAQGTKSGVSQSLVRLSYTSALSQIRRASSGIEETSKAVEPRLLHTTQFGYICPAETPEGAKVGLMKNIALMAQVTTGNDSDRDNIITFIKEYSVRDEMGCSLAALKTFGTMRDSRSLNDVKIFINGAWIGSVGGEHIHRLVADLRQLRSMGQISRDTGIAYLSHKQELVISTDFGRVTRPLFVVEATTDPTFNLVIDLRLTLEPADLEEMCLCEPKDQWSYLTGTLSEKGRGRRLIEYLDPYEEENSYICMDVYHFRREMAKAARVKDILAQHPPETALEYIKTHNVPLAAHYTHLEIHPSMVLSAITSLIPFPDHNQSPRNLYQASMGKQAVGIYALNFMKRFDTSSINVMHYPQLPLVTTRSMPHVKFRYLPAGQNAIVAIGVYSGFNQEDSLVMSQSAVDRGFMRATYYHTYEDYTGSRTKSLDSRERTENFGRPNEHVHDQKDRRCSEYLEADGLPAVGKAAGNQKIIIGKIIPRQIYRGGTIEDDSAYVDGSVAAKMDEKGRIDAVILAQDQRNSILAASGIVTEGSDGLLGAKVRVRSSRVPQVGDKFSSRHGQKGTVGMLFRHEDMPYTLDGITPDIIMNPHAIPSRMTIGQLLECVGAKMGALSGREIDGTAFNAEPGTLDELITTELHAQGYQKHGYEALINGMTGELLNYRVFIGPTFYQRLKHMVLDKISARSTGPIVTLTHQPNEGRSNYGGMRIGEMEKDAFIAHGATAVLRDRLLFSSDAAEFLVCCNCGLICWHADQNKLTTTSEPMCVLCRTADVLPRFARVVLPYATKTFFQEVIAMGVFPHIVVNTK